MKLNIKLAAQIAAITCVTAGSAIAQDADNDGVWMLEDLTCRDLIIRSGEERDLVVIFMHGFMSGAMNDLKFDAPALTVATDAVLESCINDPAMPLMAAFKSARE